ncbi:unnamed protein product [Rotaria magnacalcarata]|uniref:Uncharacterized protein n=1 Tax=Rotaria magnacalcarata TaxID=392030 RepID=A0A8S3G136_9BILA|nr:unnamed protein product [Rotaria magnacalcarata]CAF5143262.1 unnamed protein product [Rotaria magnacalcarata]
MAAILRQLCFIPTLSIQLNRYINLNKETFDYYCHLIESFVNILYSIIQIENTIHNKLALSSMGTLTSNLYTMTLSIQFDSMRSNQRSINKTNGIPLFFRCLTETIFKSLQVQLLPTPMLLRILTLNSKKIVFFDINDILRSFYFLPPTLNVLF